VSALTGTDPLLLMEVEPANAHEFVICCAVSRFLFDAACVASLVDRETVCQTEVAIAACASFFVWLRAVSSSRPTFQSAPRGAVVKRGAEQPGATRSALQRAWRGLRAPDLDRREHGATMVVGGEPEVDTNRVVAAPDIGAAATWAGGASGWRERDRTSGAGIRPCWRGASGWPAVPPADPDCAGTARRYGW
jgi:hypothetical protein